VTRQIFAFSVGGEIYIPREKLENSNRFVEFLPEETFTTAPMNILQSFSDDEKIFTLKYIYNVINR